MPAAPSRRTPRSSSSKAQSRFLRAIPRPNQLPGFCHLLCLPEVLPSGRFIVGLRSFAVADAHEIWSDVDDATLLDILNPPELGPALLVTPRLPQFARSAW